MAYMPAHELGLRVRANGAGKLQHYAHCTCGYESAARDKRYAARMADEHAEMILIQQKQAIAVQELEAMLNELAEPWE